MVLLSFGNSFSLMFFILYIHQADAVIAPTPNPPPPRGPEFVITINSTNSFAADNYLPYQKSERFSFLGLIQKSILNEILKLHQGIKNLRVKTSKSNFIQLDDLCLKPNGTECKIESILQYFQLDASNLNECIPLLDMLFPFGPSLFPNPTEDWHDQIIGCTRFPYSKSNGNYLKMSCLSTYGQPVLPKDVLEGYERTPSSITAESILIRLAVTNISTPEHVRNINVFKDGLETLLKSWESSAGQKLKITTSLVYSNPEAPTTTSNGVLLKSSFYGIILVYLIAIIFYNF